MSLDLHRMPAAIVAGLIVGLGSSAHPAQAEDLRGFVKNLYGGDGIDLAGSTPRNRTAFTESSFGGLESLDAEIASNLGLLSTGSAGATFTFDLEQGIPVRTPEPLGPLVAERADTIGAGRLQLAFSYTQISFKQFNGEPLGDLVFSFESADLDGDGTLGPVPGEPNPDFQKIAELDELRVHLDVAIDEDIFAFYVKYGLTDFWDVEVILPVIRLDVRTDANAEVVCNTISRPLCDSAHRFDPSVAGTDAPNSSSGGSATGIGDMLLRTKYNFLRDRGAWPDLAFQGQIKVPSGDEDQLLGTGTTDFRFQLIASRHYGRIIPHANISYEVSTGPSELYNLRYLAGAEAMLHPKLTLGADFLGRWAPDAAAPGNHLVDFAAGLRWNVFGGLLVNAIFQVPVNKDSGLRPDWIWTLGLEYAFDVPWR